MMIRKAIFGIVCSLPMMAQADEVVIAALGDSLTQGYGLVQEDGFVPQLQAWLAEQGADVTIINAGVSGDTTAGGLSRVDWTLTPDVDALIVALGGNDLLRGIAPEVSRANLQGILSAAAANSVPVLLVGMQAPETTVRTTRTHSTASIRTCRRTSTRCCTRVFLMLWHLMVTRQPRKSSCNRTAFTPMQRACP